MEENQDLVVFVDDAGDEKTMEVLDYFFYEGKEYAILTEYNEDEEEHVHTEECDHDHELDAFIMQVEPVGEDEEEFIPVDEGLMDKLIDFVQNELYGDDDDEDEEEEEDE
ncbi:DUF1292 domain-containing protein [Eubacteriales bacterium OttesenSCG-928-N13]|nr:DUF1292 domain-containing protein [Eubacteriales bacterium OttesenSCG-928-N13]